MARLRAAISLGMTLCVESFIGRQGVGEGVKLEQQLLVTESGAELLGRFSFEDALLAWPCLAWLGLAWPGLAWSGERAAAPAPRPDRTVQLATE